MTISKISVNADYCFGPDPLQIDDLKDVNYIFAPNGSGKTTISKALSEQPDDADSRKVWSVAPTSLKIRVYNESYRQRVLKDYMDGIFTIGENASEIFDLISSKEQLNRQRYNTRAQLAADIGSKDAEGIDATLYGKIRAESEFLMNVIFEEGKAFPEPVKKIAFSGLTRNKKKFRDEALHQYCSLRLGSKQDEEGVFDNPDGRTFSDLGITAKSLISSAEKKPVAPGVDDRFLLTDDDIGFLESEKRLSVSSENATFSNLLNKWGNQDWVSEGRHFIAETSGLCPFCQQGIPKNLITELELHFAQGFDRQLARARELNSRISQLERDLVRSLETIEVFFGQTGESVYGPVKTACDLVRSQFRGLVAAVEKKLQHPMASVKVDSPNDSIRNLNEIIEDYNKGVTEHNRLVDHRDSETKKFKDYVWLTFLARANVSGALKRFVGVQEEVIEKIKAKETLRSKLQAEIDGTLNEIAELRKEISNTGAVAERINKTLSSIGFNRFRIVIEDSVRGGYRVVRRDGSPAHSTLSEGERSFLTFAYYWESITGADSSGGHPEELVAVVDDPITSLDSETLFLVAAYLRDGASKVRSGLSNVRQLIVLTHNTQFHHEASYGVRSKRGSGPAFYRLIKGRDKITRVISDHEKSRIRGNYSLLWEAVVAAASDDGIDDSFCRAGIFNVVRRIIEYYFKNLGCGLQSSDVTAYSPVDSALLRAFDIEVNSGSHTLADDVDFVFSEYGVGDFLISFRRYFEVRGHLAHFEMMVRAAGGEAFLEPGACLGPIDIGDEESDGVKSIVLS